jgi:hypothetical protein
VVGSGEGICRDKKKTGQYSGEKITNRTTHTRDKATTTNFTVYMCAYIHKIDTCVYVSHIYKYVYVRLE